MKDTIAPLPQDGYGWRMSDSDRLNARLEQDVARRIASRTRPQPFSAAAMTEKIVKHLRTRDRIDPQHADELLELAEQKIQREWWERKAEVMLGRLPSMYRGADFPRTEWGLQARRWVDAYRAGARAGLVILGNVGTGKTWLGAAIARSLMLDGPPVPATLITVTDMLAQLRQSIGHDLGIDMAQFATAPVLILDDLGQEQQTDWTREQMYRLAHARSHNGLPIIVTSNLSGDQIKAQYEPRTVQRLFGGASLINIPGESRRDLPF